MIYNKIYDFCKVKNVGNCSKNGDEPTPRVKFIIDLLEKEGIEYELDIFEEERRYRPRKIDIPKNNIRFKYFDEFYGEDDENIEEIEPLKKNLYYNIVMRGSSNKMVIAHHDIINPNIDNANDNSCSVINVIATKKLRPNINAVIVDGEELGGIGSSRLGNQIVNGDFGNIQWVLNLELSGKGGKYFFIGDYPGPLGDRIKKMFDCPVVRTPFNDSVTLRSKGIDSTVINPLPPLPEGETSQVLFNDGKYLDFKMLHHCHNDKDTVQTISPTDMKEFVEEVVLKIIG